MMRLVRAGIDWLKRRIYDAHLDRYWNWRLP